MSMLAEPKRKQRWSLNPRGKHWSEDSNKFGQKLLEKMGWSHGKGLGANEDGITENIKLSYKNDSKGMGYKETEQWTSHDDNFSELLQSLSDSRQIPNEIEQTNAPASLELKSQSSSVRIHYHKFTRGKDITRYSEKDLANIFGRKSLKKVKRQQLEESPTTKESNENLLERGSMTDYFKKKMPNFGKNSHGYVIGSNGVLTKDAGDDDVVGFGFQQETACDGVKDESDEDVPSFGFGFKQNDEATLSQCKQLRKFDGNEALKEETEIRKSKKSKKRNIENENEDEGCVVENSRKKKKKRKCENILETQDKDEEKTEGAAEVCNEQNGGETQIATEDPNVNLESSKRRKSKKKKCKESFISYVGEADYDRNEAMKKSNERKVDDANGSADVGNKLEKSLVKKKSKKMKRENVE